jgi:hypothetical protein
MACTLGENSPGPWIDYELITEVVRQCPDFFFVFLGPDHEGSVSRLPQLANVRWLGPKPYATLQTYASLFQVATVPFQVNNVTRSSCPVKIFEYLALGKPIVSTALPECRRYRGVLIAEDPADYVRQLHEAIALSKKPTFTAMMAQEARANTWEQRAHSCIDRLQNLQKRLGIPVKV